ncbi:hypothetical protein KIH86_16630 [Paenibacillus sp. HN-1]|uniref:hypothetical protein n=1 Tax=Paenibacillus TaxID=44249 RepID=UPI001CA9E43A|nr:MULTISPECIES: hypothetical protein [Paenibacillus]MBY9082009.1 hypothetical protein [Paenibacillus sp. CGMCC 1.18879]MBY9085833.1 hypothetical protein [Paenibacillus sinensis]
MIEEQSMKYLRFLMPEGDKLIRSSELPSEQSDIRRVCRLHYRSGDKDCDLLIYVNPRQVIILRKGRVEPECHALDDPGHEQAIREAILEGIILPEAPFGGREDPALLMSKMQYREILNRASGSILQLCRYVKRTTGDSRLSIRFAFTVRSPRTSGELRIGSRQGRDWTFQYASFLGSRCCGWLLRMSCGEGQDWVSASTVDKELFCSIFLDWLLHWEPDGKADVR